MRLDANHFRQPDHASPEDAARCLTKSGFRRLDEGFEQEIYQREDWRIVRLEPGKDVWMCYEGQVRWYVGRLAMALATAAAPPAPVAPAPAPERTVRGG